MKVKLIRQFKNNTQTIGVLYVFNQYNKLIFKCFTLELPWKDNKPFISRIPPGIYPVKKIQQSPSFSYAHFLIQEVENRSMIKIHAANFVDQLNGCIAIGESKMDIDNDGIVDISNSLYTMEILVDKLPNTFMLELL